MFYMPNNATGINSEGISFNIPSSDVYQVDSKFENYIDCIICNNYVRTCSLMGMSGKKGDNGKIDTNNTSHMNLFFEVCQMLFKLSISINFLSRLGLFNDYPYNKFQNFMDVLNLSGDDICKNPKDISLETISQELDNAYSYLEDVDDYFSEKPRIELKNIVISSANAKDFCDDFQLFGYFVLCTNEKNQEDLQMRIRNVLSNDGDFKSFWEN